MKNLLWVLAAYFVYKNLSAKSVMPSNQVMRAGLQDSFGNPSAMPPIDKSAMSRG